MEGYIINKAPMWMHAMKRAVAPGGKIPISELYDQYGKKHDLAKGDEFISWLKNVKLKDNDMWGIVLEDEPVVEEEVEIEEKRVDITTLKPKDMDISDVVSLSVRQAREVIPKTTDLKLLKYALSEAKPRAGKDSLCRILMKRIKELEIQRR
jgi:hypothetical protein